MAWVGFIWLGIMFVNAHLRSPRLNFWLHDMRTTPSESFSCIMVLSFKRKVSIIKDPGICMDVLRNTTDNFTVTRVSGPSCDQMTGLEKLNHQLLFAVWDGELLRHVNHKRPSVCAVNLVGMRHQNSRSRVSGRGHVIDSIPSVHPFVMSCWIDDCIGVLKMPFYAHCSCHCVCAGGGVGVRGGNWSEVCELKLLRKNVKPRKVSNY
jgi:hypothetical protein